MEREIIITGTDTDVGKTFVCAGLCCALLKGGKAPLGLVKLVSTGEQGLSPDIHYVCEVLKGFDPALVNGIKTYAPYCFGFPASPHLAAELEGRMVDTRRIRQVVDQARRENRVTVIEGVGGLMVPVTRGQLLIELLKELRSPVILVARSGLGTINHTLLSVEALRYRQIPIAAIVLNSVGFGGVPLESPEEIIRDNLSIISEFAGVPVYGPVSYGLDPAGAEAGELFSTICYDLKLL